VVRFSRKAPVHFGRKLTAVQRVREQFTRKAALNAAAALASAKLTPVPEGQGDWMNLTIHGPDDEPPVDDRVDIFELVLDVVQAVRARRVLEELGRSLSEPERTAVLEWANTRVAVLRERVGMGQTVPTPPGW
jgi:hypothetical protein